MQDLARALGSLKLPPPRRGVSRRSFLKAGTTSAAALAALGLLGPAARRARAGPGLSPDPRLTLVKRITQGFSLVDYALCVGLGYATYLEWQLHPEWIDDSQVQALLQNFPVLSMTSAQIYATYRNQAGQIYQQLLAGTFLRSVLSRRQLYERMVEFWWDHFNIDFINGHDRYLAVSWDRDVIRKYALGKFPDLLKATAYHPAMLHYLDNDTNVRGKPQENYARELLELHTLGADRGYTQKDVQEVARCFTGWTWDRRGGTTYGTFRFIASRHDTGAKQVLGVTIPANQPGTADGDKVLQILSTHPNTATFLGQKLAKWFLGYNPPKSVVDAAAQAYKSTGGDIKAMLRVILAENVVRQYATPKFQRPRHFLQGLLRSTLAQLRIQGRVGPAADLIALGQLPHRWPTPDGFPDKLDAWATALHPRWDVASRFFAGQVRYATTDPVRLLQLLQAHRPGHQAWGINLILTGGTMTPEEEQIVQRYLDLRGASTATIREAFALAAASPSAQWY